jgi:tRNA(adenine34) deaminase
VSEWGKTDSDWMAYALTLAAKGELLGEVPVGAVIVRDGEILGEGWNCPISGSDPTAHAEIVAIRDAARRENNYRLPGSTLYVTLEPCTMCAGATVHARVAKVVYGATEPKAGVVESRASLLESAFFNHKVTALGGVLAENCQHQLSDFFKKRREQHRLEKEQKAAVVTNSGFDDQI